MRRKIKTILKNLKVLEINESIDWEYRGLETIEIKEKAENVLKSIYCNGVFPLYTTLINNGITCNQFDILVNLVNRWGEEYYYNYKEVRRHFYSKKLGLIKGRHDLPVKEYILEEECTEFTKAKLQPIITKRLQNINFYDDNVDLYITGLTIVTLTAVEELKKMDKIVHVYGYNPNTKKYYYQGTF